MAWSEWKKFGGIEYLGEGTTFDIKPYCKNYSTLTVDNFIVEPVGSVSVDVSITKSNPPGYWKTASNASIVKSYDSNTGILTAYLTSTCYLHSSWSPSDYGWATDATKTGTINVKCYFVP